MSRHRFLLPSLKLSRDTKTRSRPSWRLHLCRDIISMSRPHTLSPMSRHQSMSRLQFLTGQVATPVSCRDLLETNLCRNINFMSRPHFCHSEISKSRRQHPGGDLPHCHPCRDLINDVVTSTQPSPIFTTSRPRLHVATQTPLVQVATPTGRRDTNPSSFCNFFFFQSLQ